MMRHKYRKLLAATTAALVLIGFVLILFTNARIHAMRTIVSVGGSFAWGTNLQDCTAFSGTPDNIGYLNAWHPVALVDLGNSDVSTDQITEICGSITELKLISVGNTAIDDAAISPLLKLKEVQIIHVEGSMISSSGVASLRAAFPKARVFEFHEIP